MNFEQFLNTPAEVRHAWIDEPNLRAYVRKTIRYIGREMYNTLDIANVEVTEEERGKKIFTKFLDKVEKAAKERDSIVFIESILSERFYNFLLKRGYRPRPSEPSSLYKKI